MIFASDNWSGAAPEVAASLTAHSAGFATAYGDGELDARVEERFSAIFETECDVFFVGTGTAANSMAAAAVAKPGGVIFAHDEAHVIANEGGAPESFTNGGRIVPIGGANGKIDPELLSQKISQYPNSFNHLGQGTLVTITQSTEAGTVYGLDEISKIAEVASAVGLPLHLDGARFANGLVALGCSPAEMTWKRGVDMVSFGGTKNGCWCAEALLIFNPEISQDFKFIRKRMGHLFSKTRFISAQFEAYLKDGLWLDLARHSNDIGAMLESAVKNSNRVRLAWPSQSNQVFFIADREYADGMLAKGAQFYPFAIPKGFEKVVGETEQVYRLVASFTSTTEDVQAFADLI